MTLKKAKKRHYVAFFDFDNTITTYDILDDIIARFSRDDGWVELVLMLAILTMKRNNDYSSEVTLWNDTAEKNPGNPRAHYALAMALGRSGRVDRVVTTRARGGAAGDLPLDLPGP